VVREVIPSVCVKASFRRTELVGELGVDTERMRKGTTPGSVWRRTPEAKEEPGVSEIGGGAPPCPQRRRKRAKGSANMKEGGAFRSGGRTPAELVPSACRAKPSTRHIARRGQRGQRPSMPATSHRHRIAARAEVVGELLHAVADAQDRDLLRLGVAGGASFTQTAPCRPRSVCFSWHVRAI
jgi:hypothetical protein